MHEIIHALGLIQTEQNRTEARRTYTINSEYLKDLWESQNDQCFYMKIPMDMFEEMIILL